MKINYVFAYTNSNLGDDLFLYILCNRYPNEIFLVETDNVIALKSLGLKNLVPFYKDELLFKSERKLLSTSFIKKAAIRCKGKIKCYIQIGGSLFMEENNWNIHLKRHDNFLNKRLPYFLLGCNFGPYKSQKYYETFKSIFRDYTDVCFRDSSSYQLFSDNDNSRYADDIVFTLEKPSNIRRNRKVAISVIDISERENIKVYASGYVTAIKKIINLFLKLNYEVILLSFCPNEGDTNVAEALKNMVAGPVEILEYRSDIKEIIDTLASTEYIIATRFHAMILGLSLGIPTFPIIYSEKMSNVLNDIGFDQYSISINNIKNIQLDRLVGVKSFKVKNHNAERHFSKLDEFLTRRD